MNSKWLYGLLAVLFLSGTMNQVRGQSDYLPGTLYVKFKDDPQSMSKVRGSLPVRIRQSEPAFKAAQSIRQSKQKLPAGLDHRLRELQKIQRVAIAPSLSVIKTARKLSGHPAVEYAEPVYQPKLLHEPNDKQYPDQSDYLRLINAHLAWDVTKGSSDVLIAIIDTGTDIDHPDLQGNLWSNPAETENGNDDDGNGYIDDINGWDFYNGDNNPRPGNNSNHGTHVTGIAAASTNNGVGVAGVGYNVSYLPLKIADDEGSNLRFGYDAILYAAQMGAKIINVSWGSTQYSQANHEVIQTVYEMGSLVIGAAGNDGNQRVFYPAGYPEALAVGAATNSEVKADFSNYGPFVDLLAPGVKILSTGTGGGYFTENGTSMATPVTSGVAALVLSAHPEIDIDQLRAQLVGTTSGIIAQNESRYLTGTGLLDAQAAVGPLVSSIEVVDFAFDDSPANNNGLFERNETLNATVEFKNYGIEISETTVDVSSVDSDQFPVSGEKSVTLDPLPHSATSTQNFQFKINTGPSDYDVQSVVRLRISTPQRTQDQSMDVTLVPSLATFTANSIEFSVDGKGHIGYSYTDFPDEAKGSSFIIRSSTPTRDSLVNTPLLFEGGILMGFGANEPITDGLRGGTSGGQNDDFHILRPYLLRTLDGGSYQQGAISFADSRTNITVTNQTHVFGDEGHGQYAIINYRFFNESDQSFPRFIPGFFFDFDLPEDSPNNDYSYYDADNDMIVVEPNAEDTTNKLRIGATLVGGLHTPWIINYNGHPSNDFYFGLNNGFTDAEKWQAISTSDLSSGSYAYEIGPADVSFTMAPDTLQLGSGEYQQLTAILAYGFTKSEMVDQINKARQRVIEKDLLDIEQPSGTGNMPQRFEISSVYPNPFNPRATVEVRLPSASHITVSVYDLIGRRVANLHQGFQPTGTHRYALDGTSLASGLYIIRLQSQNGSLSTQKVMLLK